VEELTLIKGKISTEYSNSLLEKGRNEIKNKSTESITSQKW
jgi:hypothetical protein